MRGFRAKEGRSERVRDARASVKAGVTDLLVATRLLLSYIPIELYYAHPFQRPNRSWVFGFNIIPGW